MLEFEVSEGDSILIAVPFSPDGELDARSKLRRIVGYKAINPSHNKRNYKKSDEEDSAPTDRLRFRSSY